MVVSWTITRFLRLESGWDDTGNERLQCLPQAKELLRDWISAHTVWIPKSLGYAEVVVYHSRSADGT